jgi:hypothetical protein
MGMLSVAMQLEGAVMNEALDGFNVFICESVREQKMQNL